MTRFFDAIHLVLKLALGIPGFDVEVPAGVLLVPAVNTVCERAALLARYEMPHDMKTELKVTPLVAVSAFAAFLPAHRASRRRRQTRSA